MPFGNSFSPSWIPRDSWDGSPVMQFCENRWNHWMAWFLNLGGLLLVIYIYIYFIQYRYRMYMFICYKNESTLQKVSRFKSFRFFGGEWLYRTQMKVDIYQAKGMLKVPFWWRLVKKKPHKWWEYHISSLAMESWMTGFQAERLDDCYLADISVFDLICIDFHSLTIHGTGKHH